MMMIGISCSVDRYVAVDSSHGRWNRFPYFSSEYSTKIELQDGREYGHFFLFRNQIFMPCNRSTRRVCGVMVQVTDSELGIVTTTSVEIKFIEEEREKSSFLLKKDDSSNVIIAKQGLSRWRMIWPDTEHSSISAKAMNTVSRWTAAIPPLPSFPLNHNKTLILLSFLFFPPAAATSWWWSSPNDDEATTIKHSLAPTRPKKRKPSIPTWQCICCVCVCAPSQGFRQKGDDVWFSP